MMVPVISRDGKKVAYVSADEDPVAGVADSGWRRGLSMFSLDQATRQVSSKKRLLNNYSSSSNGTPVKWPFFESDSRSLLYVETDPAEYCSAADGGNNIVVNSDIKRACFQAVYGSMSPTTRGYWPGKIYSIDTAATNPAGTRVELAKLNDAEARRPRARGRGSGAGCPADERLGLRAHPGHVHPVERLAVGDHPALLGDALQLRTYSVSAVRRTVSGVTGGAS